MRTRRRFTSDGRYPIAVSSGLIEYCITLALQLGRIYFTIGALNVHLTIRPWYCFESRCGPKTGIETVVRHGYGCVRPRGYDAIHWRWRGRTTRLDASCAIRPIAILSCLIIDGVSLTDEFRGNLPIDTLGIFSAGRAGLHFQRVVVRGEAGVAVLRCCLGVWEEGDD